MLSVRENMRRAFQHKLTEWVPFVSTDMTYAHIPCLGDGPRPREDGTMYDGFGVRWINQPGVGNMHDETVPPIVQDITCWRDYVKFPDLDAFDWERGGAETNARWEQEDKFRGINLYNGMWERAYMLCGFENALCYLLTDPDEIADLISAIADFRVEEINRIGKYYKADRILMHDDYGSSNRLMMSEDTWREIIKPNLAKVVNAIHENGMLYEHHSCGYTAPLVKHLVELGVDALQPVGIDNDPVKLKREFGSQIAIMGGFDIQGIFDNVETTYEVAYAEAMKTLEALAPGGSYIVLHPSMIQGPNFEETDRGLRDALRDYNKAHRIELD